jgi:hypothetical protein
MLATIAGLAATAATGRSESSLPRQPRAIERENAKPGTQDWLLTKPRIDPTSKFRCPWIEGYCSHASILAGQEIRFFVSTKPVSRFSISIYRLGYYGGTGGRLVGALGPFEGQMQPDPPVEGKRLRNCQWQASAAWTVPSDALSGVYLGKLTAETEGVQSYVIFIVRDERKADFLFQCSDHTWQAYNRWPDHFALYDDGKTEWYWGGNVQVSFNRPYGKYCQIFDQPLSTGSGEFLLWEFPFAYWMEQHGYDVSYISNTDTNRDGAGLARAKGFLSVGHDEYWTQQMYDNVKGAISRGVSVGFFSGNAVCGKVAWDEQLRAFERIGVFGPPGGTIEFSSMKGLAHEPPYANELIGAHSTGPVTGGADWICELPGHWIFEGTGMKKGEGIPGLVGWEWHGDPAKIAGLEIVATAPTQSAPGKPNGGVYTATVYPGPKDNVVFNAATIWWADGLAAPPGYVRPAVYTTPKGPDPRVQRITKNILDRMRR